MRTLCIYGRNANGSAIVENDRAISEKNYIKNYEYNPAIPLLCIYPKELKTRTWTDICTPMFIAALLTRAKNGNHSNFYQQPWLVWLSWLSTCLQNKRSPVWFPVRTHAWVGGQIPSWGIREATNINVSFPFSLPPLLSENKYIKSKKTKENKKFLQVN